MFENDGLSIFGETKSKDALLAMSGIGQGRVYYVNNITGASGNNGLSWGSAMDEIETAVTASEVYRKLPATTNEYIRNTIVIQGTGTPYTHLTDVGEHINFIGLGDNPLGNAAGIVRVGADTGRDYGILTTETVRGNYFYNIQFQAGGLQAAVKFTNIFRTTFERCGFFTNGAPETSPTYGFWTIGPASGLHLKDCYWGNASGATAFAANGLYINGTHFHNCLVEGCYITGTATGVYIGSNASNSWGSLFRDCYMGGGSSTACEIGIDDNTAVGHIRYQNCYLDAADPIEPSNDGTRFVGCIAENAFVST